MQIQSVFDELDRRLFVLDGRVTAVMKFGADIFVGLEEIREALARERRRRCLS